MAMVRAQFKHAESSICNIDISKYRIVEHSTNVIDIEKERVIIPTNSVFIEALPGKHPIMEDFKLAHRGLDVKKVQAEVRHAELENLRLAARLIAGEREDPDIEKVVINK
jgi:hypothetical protein